MTVQEGAFVSRGEEETRDLGRQLGLALRGGELIALVGHLGAGKTQLVKGIAEGNQPDGSVEVTSPTFTLVQEYAGRLHLYHLDCYRLCDCAELEALGLDEMITPTSTVVVEWADKVEDVLPDDRVTVRITSSGLNERHFSLEASGAASDSLLRRWRAIHPSS